MLRIHYYLLERAIKAMYQSEKKCNQDRPQLAKLPTPLQNMPRQNNRVF